jgi:hypothetical protein
LRHATLTCSLCNHNHIKKPQQQQQQQQQQKDTNKRPGTHLPERTKKNKELIITKRAIYL